MADELQKEVAPISKKQFKGDTGQQIKNPLDTNSARVIFKALKLIFNAIDLQYFSHTLTGLEPQTDTSYAGFFVAPFPLKIQEIVLYADVAASNSGTTVLIEKLTATQGPTAGVRLTKTTTKLHDAGARSAYYPPLTLTAADLIFKKGDTVSWVTGGSLADIQNLTIGLTFTPL